MNTNLNLGTERRRAHFGGLQDRRSTSRFPLREEVRYRVVQSKSSRISGSGATLNIGSTGILFTTLEKLPLGQMVEISVNWPARLGGTCPLQFVAMGKVIRSDAGQAAVKIERYEFKTRSAIGATATNSQKSLTATAGSQMV